MPQVQGLFTLFVSESSLWHKAFNGDSEKNPPLRQNKEKDCA
jgi:hypothetical protein